MDKQTFKIMEARVKRGEELQNKLFLLKRLRKGLDESNNLNISIPCDDGFRNITETCYLQELYGPCKESIADIIDNQIKMYEIEFKEL